jgi:hypothetical protein
MEVQAKRQRRRRGQGKALSESHMAEVKRWNNCNQTISVKMLAGKFVGTFVVLKEQDRSIQGDTGAQ